jgi:hypothetical protein
MEDPVHRPFRLVSRRLTVTLLPIVGRSRVVAAAAVGACGVSAGVRPSHRLPFDPAVPLDARIDRALMSAHCWPGS